MKLISIVTLFAAIVASNAASKRAFAQGVSPVPLLHPALDMSHVPVGTWLEYRVSVGGRQFTQRYSYLGETAAGRTVEIALKDPIFVAPMVFRMFEPRKGSPASSTQSLDVQIGDTSPITMTVPRPPADQLSANLESSKPLGVETIVVPAGTFRAKHLRTESDGTTVDLWANETNSPRGTIRVSQKSTSGTTIQELVGFGSGGKPAIKRTATPVPQEEFSRALLQNLKGR